MPAAGPRQRAARDESPARACTSSIFSVISQSAPRGLTLRRIAYVEPPPRTPSGAEFAETIAKNRGVNVRLFRDLAAAHAWLSEEL